MDGFTPVSGLLGGMMIGLAATLMLLLNGRISGISGIVGGLVSPRAREGGAAGRDAGWRVAFGVGLVLGPLGYAAVAGGPLVGVEATVPVLVVAGLLVGFGTRLGSGCTSGHGVCGIARLSRRSIFATAVFMSVAAATVFVTHHMI